MASRVWRLRAVISTVQSTAPAANGLRRIARLLEEKGDPKAALPEFQRFLTFWAHADADFPELAEARRAVARLQAFAALRRSGETWKACGNHVCL
jgi:hypothetical protein